MTDYTVRAGLVFILYLLCGAFLASSTEAWDKMHVAAFVFGGLGVWAYPRSKQ